MPHRRVSIWMLRLLFAAFALRVLRLDAQSLWWDELFGIAIGTQPFPHWLWLVLDNRGNPPGIYFLETIWTQIGVDAFTVRYLDVLFGVLAVAIIYRVGRLILSDEWVGVVAAGLLTFSPHHLWYSQEARMYAPQICFALAASYFYMRMLHQPTWRTTVGYSLSSVAVLYLHYHPFLLLAQMVFLAWYRRKYSRALGYWLAGIGLIGLIYAPWFLAVFTTGGLERAPMGWVPAAQWFDPLLTLYVFWLGATNDPGMWWNWIGYALALMCVLIGVRAVMRNPSLPALGLDRLLYALIWLVLPILMVWTISLDLPLEQKRSAYVDRYLSPEFPAFLLLVALGARRLLEKRPRLFILGAIAAIIPMTLSLATMYYDPFYGRDNWRDAAALVRAQGEKSRDLLILREDQQLPLFYYGTGDSSLEVISIEQTRSPRVLMDAALARNPQARRLWLFSGTNPNNVHRFVVSPDQQRSNGKQDIAKRVLDASFAIEQELLYPGILVTIYTID